MVGSRVENSNFSAQDPPQGPKERNSIIMFFFCLGGKLQSAAHISLWISEPLRQPTPLPILLPPPYTSSPAQTLMIFS